MYRVYVIRNETGRHYVGISDDVNRRLADHNAGTSKWTKGKGPWSIVWTSQELSLSDARQLENKLKRQGRGSGFYAITGLERLAGS